MYREMVKSKTVFDLPGEVLNEARKIKQTHTEVSDKAGMVYDYLQIPITEDWYQMDRYARREYINKYDPNDPNNAFIGEEIREKICVLEVWFECYGGDIKSLSPLNSREINDILRTFDDWEQGDNPLIFGVGYGRQRAFSRVKKSDNKPTTK